MIFLSLSPNLTKIVCISGIEGTFKFLPIEVFNTETNYGYNFPGIAMNRQTNFIYEKYIFIRRF